MNGYAQLGLPAVPGDGSGASRPQQLHPTHPEGVSLQQFFWMLLSLGVLKGKIPLCYGAAGVSSSSILSPSISSGK